MNCGELRTTETCCSVPRVSSLSVERSSLLRCEPPRYLRLRERKQGLTIAAGRAGVPDTESLRAVGSHDVSAVGRELDHVDRIGVDEDAEEPERPRVPDPRGAVEARAREVAAVGAVGDVRDALRVLRQDGHDVPGPDVRD